MHMRLDQFVGEQAEQLSEDYSLDGQQHSWGRQAGRGQQQVVRPSRCRQRFSCQRDRSCVMNRCPSVMQLLSGVSSTIRALQVHFPLPPASSGNGAALATLTFPSLQQAVQGGAEASESAMVVLAALRQMQQGADLPLVRGSYTGNRHAASQPVLLSIVVGLNAPCLACRPAMGGADKHPAARVSRCGWCG